ncbi:hypothetical protein M0R45_020910 [Rubus argutus]|uniref:Potassium channel tetramerisation-type BTB domain-containing protein n=1 Tax=Rubus argutus TaxID=59490 RepID=A0AAW1XC38_RUBAR
MAEVSDIPHPCGRHTLRLEKGYVFIDRNGKHFGYILDWLRTGVVPTLKHNKYTDLKLEADYFQLAGLIDGIHGLNLSFAVVKNVCFSNTLLRETFFENADAEGASFRGADFVGGDHSIKPDLSGANLSNADFTDAKLEGVCLRSATLRYAKFTNTNLKNAILEGADLQGVDLREANTEGATSLKVNIDEIPTLVFRALQQLCGANYGLGIDDLLLFFFPINME